MSDIAEPIPVAEDIEALKKQLAAAVEKAERFAKQRDEAREMAKQATEHTRRTGVVYRLRMAGVDEELADVLADRAPAEDDKLPEFVTRWQAKIVVPAKEPAAPKDPEPPRIETVVSPPRPGTQPTDPSVDPMADLIKSVQATVIKR